MIVGEMKPTLLLSDAVALQINGLSLTYEKKMHVDVFPVSVY